jgi:hypothetical protein
MKAQWRDSSTVFAIGLVIFFLCALTTIAQTPQTQKEKLAAAHSAFAEGFELFQKGTAESLRAARQKFETAYELFREAGDKQGQAASLLALGRVAIDLGEKVIAIKQFEMALPLLQTLSDKLGEATGLNNICV